MARQLLLLICIPYTGGVLIFTNTPDPSTNNFCATAPCRSDGFRGCFVFRMAVCAGF
jgi:hypothetical protein